MQKLKRQYKYFLTIEDENGHQFEVPAYAESIDDINTLIDSYYENNGGLKVLRIKPDFQYNQLINRGYNGNDIPNW